MCEVKNTIKFSFSHCDAKPNIGEIVNFAKALDANPAEMEAVYRIGEERGVFMKFKSEEAMLHSLTFNSEDLIFHYANGTTAKVRMSHAGEFIQYVRVYDLPPEVPDNELDKVLGKYGKIKRIIREKFPTDLCFEVYTGIRGVYMDVKKEIPTSLHFFNGKGNIFYDGNKDKCFLCKADGHRKLSCPKRKARKEPEKQLKEKGKQSERKQNSSSTYAGVVVEGASLVISDQETDMGLEMLNEDNEMDVTTPTTDESSGEHAMGNDVQKQQQRSRFGFNENEEQIRERKKLRAREKIALSSLRSPPRKII
ncbi:uncharacterized protein LOC135714470 [Ochlerotatus camptorhynchus]|uniref:uncharacterized protein LOC135707026 n=1 Tax=Ochlerotatus camptorhynchus TaxID=644619 RepID=UPI0031E385D5